MAKCCFEKLPTLFFLLLSLGIYITHAQYAYVEEDGGNHRQGKIFKFWNGFERGLKNTANMFSRVSDNLEVAFDQITSDIEDNISSLNDELERRGTDSLEDPLNVEAVGGSFGGIDDGLEVYYPNQGTVEKSTVDRIDPLMYPKPEEIGTPDEGHSPDNFGMDYFNPFASLGNKNIFSIFSRRKPWWQGNNVCVDREEIDEKESNTNNTVEAEAEAEAEVNTEEIETGNVKKESSKPIFNFFSSLQMSSCRDNGEKYTCVTSTNRRGLHKTVKVTYRCCHGFIRDGSGCSEIELFPMPETLQKLDSTSDFLTLIKAAEMIELLKESTLTLFVPNNEAIEEYTADLEEKNEIQNSIDGLRNDVYRQRRETHNLTPILLSHMADDFLYAGDFKDEQVISSLNPESTLRINIYHSIPTTVTVNCARILTANQHSMNGVVHTIDRVLSPVDKSIADIITSDPQFSILKELLRNTGFVEELRQDGQLTFFAPTDAAFRRLKPSVLESLREGNSCVRAVLEQHILPNTICSSAIQGKMKTLNKLEEFLVVERDEDDKLFVEDAQIVARDIVGTNGIVHIIDKALVPNEAKSVSEVLESHNLTRFIELLEEAELMEEFNAEKDITVFAPTNKAIEKIPEEDFTALKNDKERLREILRYHVTTPSIGAKDINNNHLADTAAGHPLRINLYSGMPLLSGLFRIHGRHPVRVTAGCSRVSVLDSQACGAVVHIIEDLLEIPKSNILETLGNEKYAIFKQMVMDTGVDKELSEEGPFTLLVPSDHAFKTLPEEELNEILNNDELKEKIVRRHIMREHVCCSGINSNSWLFMDHKRTIDGSLIHMRRSSNGRPRAGAARIIECGSPTGNGIVHTVNRMVMSDRDMSEMKGQKFGGMNTRIFDFPGLGHMLRF